MKLEPLIMFWTMLLEASQGNVAVSRDMAEETLQMLRRFETIQELIANLADFTEEYLE